MAIKQEKVKAKTRTPAETYLPEDQTEAAAPEVTEPQPGTATTESAPQPEAANSDKPKKSRVTISTCVKQSDYDKIKEYANRQTAVTGDRVSTADIINEAIIDFIEKHQAELDRWEKAKELL